MENFGLKLAPLIFAFLGSAVSLSYAKEMTRMQAVTALAIGTVASIAGTPLALHYLSLPEGMERGVAFIIGLVAMRAIPAILSLVDTIKNIKFTKE